MNCKSLCLIFIFSLFPSDIKNVVIENIVKYFTSYTGGVYYLHKTTFLYLKGLLKSFKNGTFSGLIINYIICYIICFIGMKIFGKTKIKNLFS